MQFEQSTDEPREPIKEYPLSMREDMRRILDMPLSEFEDFYEGIQQQVADMGFVDLLLEQGTIQL